MERPAGGVGLVVGEAGVADVSAVPGIDGVVDLADDGPVGLAEGHVAYLGGGKRKRGGVGRRDGDDVRKGVGIVLELSEEEEAVPEDGAPEGSALVVPAAVGLRCSQRRNGLKVKRPVLEDG